MAKLVAFLAPLITFVVIPVLSSDNVLEMDPESHDQLLKLGMTPQLNCSVNVTEENAKLVWSTPTMQGVILRQETTVSGNKLMLRSSLVVEKFSDHHIGDYKCSLNKNGIEITEATIHLRAVKEVKTEPIFVLGSKTATLACTIILNDFNHEHKDEITHMSWLKKGLDKEVPITDREDSNRFVTVSENNTLIIKNPIREDSGVYIARFTIADRVHQYDCDVQYNAGPLVLDFEKSMNLIEGDDLDLQCVIKGYPYAAVTWYKDQKIMNGSQGGSSRVTFSDLYGHENARLFIRRVEYYDAGDYTCEAFSALFANDTQSKTITVRVKDKLAALWPFLGIVCEVVLLCTIIFIYEKRRSKQIQLEDNAHREVSNNNNCNVQEEK